MANIASDAVLMALRDVDATSPVKLAIESSIVRLQDGEDGVWLTADGDTKVGIIVNQAQPPGERLRLAASQIQDWIVETLPGAGFDAVWPECREHPKSHPLEPTNDERGTVWICPQSGNVISPIGSLCSACDSD